MHVCEPHDPGRGSRSEVPRHEVARPPAGSAAALRRRRAPLSSAREADFETRSTQWTRPAKERRSSDVAIRMSVSSELYSVGGARRRSTTLDPNEFVRRRALVQRGVRTIYVRARQLHGS